MTKDQQYYSNRPMSSGSIGKHLKKHMTDAHLVKETMASEEAACSIVLPWA